MTWNVEQIKAAFTEGVSQGASHMLVGYDDFDYENYPIYVMPGNDPRKSKPVNGDRIDECYSMSLSWDVQALESRAFHWEWDDPDKISEGAS